MKKLLTIFLALCICVPLAFGLSGCDKKSGTKTETKPQESEQTEETMQSGLYKNGTLVKTWAEIVDEHPTMFETDGKMIGNTTSWMMQQNLYVSPLADLDGDLVVDDSITYIGLAFFNCPSITSIYIPAGVTEFFQSGFCGCSALRSVTFSNNSTIETFPSFVNCAALEYVNIPASVTWLSGFSGCTALTNIDCSNTNRFAFESGFLVNTTNNTLVAYFGNETEISFPSSVKKIGMGVFSGKSIETVDLTGIESIGQDAFSGCTELTSITIPSSVTEIGGASIGFLQMNNAFSGCTNLATVVIESEVAYRTAGVNAPMSMDYSKSHLAENANTVYVLRTIVDAAIAANKGCEYLENTSNFTKDYGADDFSDYYVYTRVVNN